MAEVLRLHRVRLGISQMELAARAGLHINTVGALERAKSSVTLERLIALCDGLGIAPGEFVDEVVVKSSSGKTSKRRPSKP